MSPASLVIAKLRGLAPRERALLLAGAAAVVLFVLVRFVVFAMLDDYRKARTAIPARRATLARYLAVAQGGEAIDDALADAVDRLSDLEDGLVPGSSPSAASATLQGIIKPWIAGPDTRLMSMRTLAPLARGPYTEVAVQVDLQTSTAGLADFLARVSRQPLLLRIRKLSVNSLSYGPTYVNHREVVTATVVVAGVTDAVGDETAGGGER